MAGVITPDGQWEHCNICGRSVLIQTLRYERPSAKHSCGRDVCARCWSLTPEQRDELADRVERKWLAKQVAAAEANGWRVELRDDGHGVIHMDVVGPVAVSDRVCIGAPERRGTVTSIDPVADRVWVREDDNPIPFGKRGCVTIYPRAELSRAVVVDALARLSQYRRGGQCRSNERSNAYHVSLSSRYTHAAYLFNVRDSQDEIVDRFHTRTAAEHAANMLNRGVAHIDPHASVGCKVVAR